MHTINLEFVPFGKAAFSGLFRAIGVYVIWDAKNKIRPSYIGEGNILKRFANEHTDRFHRPINGYAAVLGEIDEKGVKSDAQICETLLLHVADATNRYPTCNVAEGFLKPIEEVFKRHGVLKVNIDGYNPFSNPKSARLLSHKKVIDLRKQGAELGLTHDWNSI